MAVRVRDLTKDWRKGDAEKLARLFNESGRGWPGGGWDPKTANEVGGRIRDERRLGIFVAEVGGNFVAFCDCAAKPNEKNRAYIPFLNAHPDYHGKGYGKAVLLSSIERVYELGIARVDLHTWPGNLKAVPLYKKSGFMWSPEEQWGVLMQNFTPGARRHPVAQQYFKKHDWYRTMKRDLSLTADDHKQGGGGAPRPGEVRVYPYEWEEDGDRLRMVYDRKSWGLVEIETNDFLVACYLEDEELVAGVPHRIRWEIVNHRPRPVEVALVASADDGIELDQKQVLRVVDRTQVSAQFEVDPDIREKEQEPQAPIIRTDIVLDGTPIRLEAGFEAKQALSFGLDAVGHNLRPGQPHRIIVQGFSELNQPVKAAVHLRGAGGVTIEPAAHEIEIPARGAVEMPVTVTGAQSGPVELKAEAEVKAKKLVIRPKLAELHLHFGRPGEIIGHVAKDAVRFDSTLLHVHISRRGGWANVGDKIRNRWQAAGIAPPQLGIPFTWEEFFEQPCEARIERDGERLTAVLTTESVYRPGIWLERRITVSNLPIVEVVDSILNGTSARFEGQIKQYVNLRGRWVSVMTRRGLIRSGSGAGRPGPEHNFAKEEEIWPETWVAMEDEQGMTSGLLWQPAYRVHGHGWWNEMDHLLPAVEPGQSACAPPLFVFVGDGDYSTVRRWWQNLYGPRVYREVGRPETREPFAFGLRPDPVVIHGKEARAKLVVDSVGQLEFDGALRVSPPEGIRITPRSVGFKSVNEARGFSKTAAVSRQPSLPEGGYFVDVTAQVDRIISRERSAVIVLGDPKRSVSVTRAGESDEMYRIDNGAFALTIAPEFQGSAVSLERDGEQLLRSAYPTARPHSWMNPWFGGIEPGLGPVGRDLAQEKFSAREITRRGSQGVVWQGVRLSCSPKQERGRHTALALDYLLAPGSSVLAVALRTTRRADTSGWLDAGIAVWPVLGGSHLDAVLSSADDPRASRIRCEFGGGIGSATWVMAENTKAAQAAFITCYRAEGNLQGTHGELLGSDGYSLNGRRYGQHEARQTRETIFYIGFADAPRARDLAEALSKLKELP